MRPAKSTAVSSVAAGMTIEASRTPPLGTQFSSPEMENRESTVQVNGVSGQVQAARADVASSATHSATGANAPIILFFAAAAPDSLPSSPPQLTSPPRGRE